MDRRNFFSLAYPAAAALSVGLPGRLAIAQTTSLDLRNKPQIVAAYTALVSVDTPQTFLLLTVKNMNILTLATTGTGFASLPQLLRDDSEWFAAMKVVGVTVASNVTSRRVKMATVYYCGSRTSAAARAAYSQHRSEVSTIFVGAGAALVLSDPSDLTMQSVARALQAAGTGHSPTYYEFSPSERVYANTL